MRSPPAASSSRFLLSLLPLAVLVGALVIAFALWRREVISAENIARTAFEHQNNRIRGLISSRLSRVGDLLRATSAEFSDAQSISNRRWTRFVEVIGLEANYSGIIGLGYVAQVKHDDLSAFLSSRRGEAPDFHIFPPGERERYLVNSYLAPSAPLAKALGFDVGSSPERLAALDAARDSGDLAATEKLPLMAGGNILLYQPIYRGGRPTGTVEERRAALRGWAAVAITVSDLMAGIVASEEPVDLEIYDGEPTRSHLLLDTDSHRKAELSFTARRHESWSQLTFGGRTWHIYIAVNSPPPSILQQSSLVLLAGGLLALILWGITHWSISRQIKAIQSAADFSEALLQSEERLRLVLMNSNDGFWDWDLLTERVFFSPQFAAILGYGEGDVAPNPNSLRQLLHPDDVKAVRQRYLYLFRGNADRIEHEFRVKEISGQWRWVRENAAVAERDGPRVTRMVGTIIDITERRRSEDLLRLLSTVVESSPLAVVITNASARIEYVNPRAVSHTGYSRDELIGATPALIKSDQTPDQVYKTLWETITAGQSWRGELLNRKKSGELYWEDTIISPVKNANGETFFVAVKEDITERKHTEDRLRQGQKMEAIGTLAGGIAHDFNNILTSIIGYNNLVLGDAGNATALTDDVHQINVAASRAKELVKQILTFSRSSPLAKEPIDLIPAIKEAMTLIRATIPKDIEVKLILEVEAAIILGTSIQIHQILINLCGNAVDALRGRNGLVTVALAPGTPGWLELSVTDNGDGIPANIRGRVFDPFFTTKPIGQGTGLGLSVVHGIIEDLGGKIMVEPCKSGGTRITIGLPELAEFFPVAMEDESNTMPDSIRPGSILVVDDEIAVAEMIRRFFERTGHSVVALSSSRQALDRIQGGERFDIIVTDQMMPEVNGIDLARAVHRKSPETAVILCSGRDDKVTPEECAAAGVNAFLTKPLNMIELTDLVDRLLSPAAVST